MKTYNVVFRCRDKVTKEEIDSVTMVCVAENENIAYNECLQNAKRLQENATCEICGLRSVREA